MTDDEPIFDDEHEDFRDAVGTFLDKEVVPHHDQWETDGIVDRERVGQGRRARACSGSSSTRSTAAAGRPTSATTWSSPRR